MVSIVEFGSGAREPHRFRASRHPVRLRSVIAGQDEDETKAYILNISSIGALLQVDRELESGEHVSLSLPEAGNCIAEVTWADGRLYGCKFSEPIPRQAVSAALLKSDARQRQGETVDKLTPTALMDHDAETYGMKIARRRQHLGITQSQFGAILGVSKTTVWKWENDEAKPRRLIRARLDAILSADDGPDDLPTRAMIGLPEQTRRETSTAPEPLGQLIERSKRILAEAAGISPDQIKLIIEV